MEEMEKRSDRHIRDLVAHTAFKGLDANEIGCARISVMAGEQLPPSKGRIQISKTNYLQTFITDLQRTAGPYRCAIGRENADVRETYLRLAEKSVGQSTPQVLW